MKRRRNTAPPAGKGGGGNGVSAGLLIPLLAAIAAAAIGIGAAELKVLRPPPAPTAIQTIVKTLGSTKKPL